MRLTPTTRNDLDQIQEWITLDPFHRDDPNFKAEEMLTPKGLLSFCLSDEKGPLVFVRLNEDGEMVRMVMQFAPESEVSKRRLVVGLIDMGIPAMKKFAKDRGYKGLIFESVSPSLIAFGKRIGFDSIGGNDYMLTFEAK
jgi:hypothetical protein